MAVHIFVTSRANFEVCIRRGLAAVPASNSADICDQLISRMAMIRRGDKLIFYVTGEKMLYGVYRALDRAFHDDTPVWPANESGHVYPFRVRIDNTPQVFDEPILLSDIYDLRDNGLIWTFGLQRPGGTTNSMFSISEVEFDQILRLFLKVNHVVREPGHIREPYRHVDPNLMSRVCVDPAGAPKYEASLSALFCDSLAQGRHTTVLGEYSDYLAYIPTSFQKEIDVLLFHSLPREPHEVVAYSLVELKRDRFSEEGLAQLLRYEDWFLKKRAGGDSRAIRTIAIARSFAPNVIDYVIRRQRLEGKAVKLLCYEPSPAGLLLRPLEASQA